MTIRQALQWAKEQLRYACERPLFEAELLLAHHLGRDRTYLVLHERDTVESLSAYEALVARRAAHEPMEYITGRVSFYDMELFIAPGALIPRPETELLVEQAAVIIRKKGLRQIVEIGIGSGAISIALARLFPELRITASDISEEALAIARQNIATFGLEERILLRYTSLLDGLEGDFKMIISNPPYIPKNTPLAPNVAEYEPHIALYSKSEGDELLKEIILLAQEREVDFLVCEMGFDQKQAITRFARDAGIDTITFYQDYAGLDRGFVVRFG